MAIIFLFYSIFLWIFRSYTNVHALFLSVVIDFPFLRLNQYFEIFAKFVY